MGYFERRSLREKLAQVDKLHANSWVHVSGSLLGSSETLSKKFSLDPSVVRDVADVHELPRVEFSDGAVYIFLRLPVGAVDSGDTVPFLAIIQKERFLTFSPYLKFSPLEMSEFLTTTTERPSSIFIATLAYIIYGYEKRVHTLTEKINDARHRLSHYEVKNSDFIEFVAIDDSLNEYRGRLEGLLSVIGQLGDNRHYYIFHNRDLESLQDISLHISQILVAINSNTHTISSIQSAYSTIANNVLNQRMKLLTAITILLAIPNVFYGMYGMNIALPFQHEPWAYVGIVSFTAILIFIVYGFAKRHRLF